MSKPKSVTDPLNPGPSVEVVPKGFMGSGKGAKAQPSFHKAKEIPNLRPPKSAKMKMPNFKSKSIRGSGM